MAEVDTVEEDVIVQGVGYFANFLQERGIDANDLLSEIMVEGHICSSHVSPIT